MRVHFTNLGCKLNQAELERLARRFHAAGHQVVGRLEEADLHVVNSCTVTHRAARDSRKVARRGGRLEGDIKTVVTGCYVSDPELAAAAHEGIDLVVPNSHKEELLERVEARFPELSAAGVAKGGGLPLDALGQPEQALAFGNTRALVKAEDGCNMKCSFCIIPFTRGRQRSRSVAEVVAEVAELVAGGAVEVVVTGVQISAYRAGQARLYDLARAILDDTDLPRLRLTSIAPWQLDPRIIDLWRDPRLCRHTHMSLQSGCDATLRRMRRPYSGERYREVVDSVRREISGMAVTTDVIVGFPGESDDEFAAGLDFVRSMDFAKIHVFPYSTREGTLAAELPDAVPHEVKRRRMEAMLEVAADSERRFQESRVGETLPVLWERCREGRWSGVSDNYLKVFAPDDGRDFLNRLTATPVVATTGGGVVGDLAASRDLLDAGRRLALTPLAAQPAAVDASLLSSKSS
ncbi:MAG: MiaB/RimO family radical SAM methylthiotransferase [Acidobacteriota bacterium]